MKKIQLTETNKRVLYESLGVLFIFLIWEIIALCVNSNSLFPDVPTLFLTFGNLLIDGSVWLGFLESFGRTFGALFVSFILALILGLMSGLNNRFRYFLKPLIEVLKLIPTPCIVFLIFLYMLKLPNTGSIIITSIIVFPILYESFVTGITNIPESVKMSLRLEGYHKAKSIFRVIIPQAFPYLLLGVLNSFGLGIKVSIVSEILLGTNSIWGIGRLIYSYQVLADYTKMFSIILLVIIIFLVIDVFLKLIKMALKKHLNNEKN